MSTRLWGTVNDNAAWDSPRPSEAAARITGYVALRKGGAVEV